MVERVYNSLTELEQNIVFKHFIKITKIPHNSFDEVRLSNYIKRWAEDMSFVVKQDVFNNLLIRKPGSNGRENEQPIILQAHMDMVCEKSPEYKHNFAVDPLPLELNGDILSTGNKTTLGADNGIGVALAMAILEEGVSHPPLDVIFTTAEEEDLSGAINIDKSWFYTNRIINLDNSVDNLIVMGSCGGKGVEVLIPIIREKVTDGKRFYELKISGLLGGHSGEDIDKGRGNAIVVLGKLLDELRREIDFDIAKIEGGNFRLAIPREAKSIICLYENDETKLHSILLKFTKSIREIYSSATNKFKIDFLNSENLKIVFSKDSRDRLIDMIILSPNGVNDFLPGIDVVESSCNIGEIHTDDDVKMITEIRATFEDSRESIYRKIELLSQKLGAKISDFAAYPSWKFNPNSRLANALRASHKSLYGNDMKLLVIHAGLEPGCFAPKIPNMDAISIGPNTWGLHSPSERLSISSTEKVHNLLIDLLKNI